MFVIIYSMYHLGPPNITYIDHNKVSLEGNKANLMCIAINDDDSDKPLQVQWYNSSGIQIIPGGSRILVYNTANNITSQVKSVLLFDPVNRTDSGVYTCKVINDPKCYTEANASLIVECKLHIRTYNNYMCICIGMYMHTRIYT